MADSQLWSYHPLQGKTSVSLDKITSLMPLIEKKKKKKKKWPWCGRGICGISSDGYFSYHYKKVYRNGLTKKKFDFSSNMVATINM